MRKPRLAFDGVPLHWLGRSRAATHIANGVNLLFPAGERFFIRSVKHYADRVSPELAAQVKGFFGQEGRHAHAHERFFEVLRGQGFEIDSILARYERIAFGGIEPRAPAELRLAVTVAAEHFTAILAEDALAGETIALAEPAVRDLLQWHAVEELEHKAVAFDVLAEVAPGYPLRMLGLVVATSLLAGFWIFATRRLMEQEGASMIDFVRELGSLREGTGEKAPSALGTIASDVFLRGIREYLRPTFHPNDRDHRALIADALAHLAARGFVPPESETERPGVLG